MMECQSNVTLSHCGCNMYFQPRGEGEPLCSTSQMDCYKESVKVVEVEAFSPSGPDSCSCLPSCTDYEFPMQTSFSAITDAKKLHLPARLENGHPEFKNDTFVRQKIAVAHFYFQ